MEKKIKPNKSFGSDRLIYVAPSTVTPLLTGPLDPETLEFINNINESLEKNGTIY